MQNKKSVFDFIRNIDGGYKQSIEIIGNETVIIENITSIIEYSEQSMRILVGKKHILINGDRLELNGYSDKSVYINGKINSIFFE